MKIIEAFDSFMTYPVYDNIQLTLKFANKMVEIIRGVTPHGGVCLFGTGTSGTALGTMLSMLDNNLHYSQIKKKGEETHRLDISNTWCSKSDIGKLYPAWIIDDRVEDGTTLNHIVFTLAKYLGYDGVKPIKNQVIDGILASSSIGAAEDTRAKKFPIKINTFYY